MARRSWGCSIRAERVRVLIEFAARYLPPGCRCGLAGAAASRRRLGAARPGAVSEEFHGAARSCCARRYRPRRGGVLAADGGAGRARNCSRARCRRGARPGRRSRWRSTSRWRGWPRRIDCDSTCAAGPPTAHCEHGLIGDLHPPLWSAPTLRSTLTPLPASRLAERLRLYPRRRPGPAVPDRARVRRVEESSSDLLHTMFLIMRFLTPDGVAEALTGTPARPRPAASPHPAAVAPCGAGSAPRPGGNVVR